MSKHIEKYPGLYARCKAARISYQAMYLRCRKGMTVDEALAKPMGKMGRPRKTPAPLPPLPERVRAFLWERPEWNAKAAVERAIDKVRVPKRILTPRDPVVRRPTTQKRYVPRRIAEDTAPLHIQRIRTAYCDGFIKTGVLDETLGTQLRVYADEQRAASKHSARVPPEHETRRYGREEKRAGDLGGGDADQVDSATARRIADFLRSS